MKENYPNFQTMKAICIKLVSKISYEINYFVIVDNSWILFIDWIGIINLSL